MTYQEFLQRYQYDPVNDRIGKGGFGVVFKAYDTHLDRYVAIKMSEVDDENDSMRLAREVELASKLPTHANIAHYEACYTFATPTGIYDFGILQYYNEGSLNELLAKGSLSMLQKTTILTQILDGIEFLHSHNVVHRDLKPRNILIARRGNEYVPKITDFGLSKEFEAANSTMFGNSITGAGTLAYASPEQLAEKSMRRNTDLWSFGVIAFQMFTGNVPFNTGSHPATSSAGRVELFRQINSGILPDSLGSITEPWQSLIRKLLVVNPETRLRNCAEARTILMGGASSSSRPADDIDTTHRESASTASQSADATQRESASAQTPPPPPPSSDTTYRTVPPEPKPESIADFVCEEETTQRANKRKTLVWTMWGILFLILLGCGGWYWYHEIRIPTIEFTDLEKMNLKGDVAYINSETFIMPDTIPYLNDGRESRHYFEEFYGMDEHYLFSPYLLSQFPFTHTEFNDDGFIVRQCDNDIITSRFYDSHNRIEVIEWYLRENGSSLARWYYRYDGKILTHIDYAGEFEEKEGRYDIGWYSDYDAFFTDITWNEIDSDSIEKVVHCHFGGHRSYNIFRSDLGRGNENKYSICQDYNENGDVAMLRYSSDDQIMTQWSFRYEYDTEGNWIKRYEYLDIANECYGNIASKSSPGLIFVTIREVYYRSLPTDKTGKNRMYFASPTQASIATIQSTSVDTYVANNAPAVVETSEVTPTIVEMASVEEAAPVEPEKVFTAVEQMPQFPGGESALMNYISRNITYPATAAENNVQGRIVVQFVVTKDGSVGEVKVVRGKDPDLDKEAVRVVKSLPKFIPGKNNGQAVNVWYTIPINFRLSN